MKPVIICGGVGTKMWPESRQKSPKHFLPLIDGKSLFELTYETLKMKFAPEDIYVSTTASQAEMAQKLISEIPKDNYILEPEMRNHGPATGLVAAFLKKKGLGDEPFMLVQPDDLREPKENFLEMLDVCDKMARKTDKYITGGIKPEFAVMGVDYLIKGEKASKDEIGIYQVAKFLWRGTKEMAEEFVKDGSALIHANHTCMTPNNLLKMYQKYKTEWYEPLMNYVNGADLAGEYAAMPKGPIEDVTQLVYAAGEALVVELPFSWFDFGTWESVVNYKPQAVSDKLIEIEAKNNFVRAKDKTVALIGVEDLIVVDTGDALLICPKRLSAKVGEVVDKLKTDNRVDLL